MSNEPVSQISDERLAEMHEDASAQERNELVEALTELQSRRSTHEGEAVAWRVKDYADGWILCHTEEVAIEEAENGNLIQPLYLHPSSSIEGVKVKDESDDVEPYDVIGTSFDGVSILAPKATSKRFTREQVQAAIKALDPRPCASLDLSPKPLEITEEIESIIDAVIDGDRYSPKVVPMGANPPLFDGMHLDNDGPWLNRVDVAKRLRIALTASLKEGV